MTITPASVRATTFAAAPRLRRGYDADQVDAFVEQIAERLESGEGLSSNDVYHVTFGRSGVGGRGYAEADVDRFLELAHAELSRLEDAWGHVGAAAVTDDASAPGATDADAEPTGTLAADDAPDDAPRPGRPS